MDTNTASGASFVEIARALEEARRADRMANDALKEAKANKDATGKAVKGAQADFKVAYKAMCATEKKNTTGAKRGRKVKAVVLAAANA